MMARDVAAVPGPSTGNMMHSARETPREIKRRAVCDGTITYNSPAVAKHFKCYRGMNRLAALPITLQIYLQL